METKKILARYLAVKARRAVKRTVFVPGEGHYQVARIEAEVFLKNGKITKVEVS